MTMLSLDNVLAAHGIPALAGGLAPNFGTGADGAFAPMQTTVSGNMTFGQSSNYFQTSGQVSEPNTAISGQIPSAFIKTSVNGYNSVASQTISAPTNGAGLSVPSGYTTGVRFSPSTDIDVYSVGLYVTSMPSGGSLYFYNVTDNVYLYGQTYGAVGTGTWCECLSQNNTNASYTLQAGKVYEIAMYSTGAVIFGTQGTTSQSVAYNNVVRASTITFPSAQDGAPVVKNFTSINIPVGVTVTISNRCQGMILLCQGNVTINGTISMDYMGAILDPTTNSGFTSIDKAFQLYVPNGANNKVIVIGPGGAGGGGGAGGSANNSSGIVQNQFMAKGGRGTNGTWFGGGSGGGGAGGAATNVYASSFIGAGASGGDAAYVTNGTGGSGNTATTPATASSFSNGTPNTGVSGSGGSGRSCAYSGVAYTTSATPGNGGSQGNSAGGAGGGGGASIWNGSSAAQSVTAQNGSSPTPGQGAGGLILIVAAGNITINSGAILSAKGCNGANGGNGASATPGSSSQQANAGGGVGGGGAGGGIIALLYKGTCSNSGSTNVSGGVGGTGGSGQNASTSYGVSGDGANGMNGNNGIVQLVQL